ncbi:MAG: tetratricopeptide repeat protein [Phenylobacterium sp.]|uniref:tetratricopeptide repeat protein n=1 Tax=Phenylobacterium sp. TaxID=1871053 RepID=UPI002734C1AE|nr:tetratricopeptide repeat protein [Phenylobacterium sp.]MDP3175226.1 tetratricopeptide repeat protein [Phenylobacterium sp.]
MEELIMTSASRSPAKAGWIKGGLLATATIAWLIAGQPAQAGLFGRDKAPAATRHPTPASAGVVEAVQRALDDDRLSDAGRLLDQAFAGGERDLRLVLLSGRLNLAKGRYDAALASFAAAEADPALGARAAEGRGLTLSRLNRSDEAVKALTQATMADPNLWRAWNALGVEQDRRKNWAEAENAYLQALKAPSAQAEVYCNQGYSMMLQGRYEEATGAFVSALQKDPGLSQARTNLRLALAMRGDYAKATTISASEDRAAVLNNAGFVAMLRGDLDQAESLFNQAIEARGSFYSRAYENLTLVRGLRKGSVVAGGHAP